MATIINGSDNFNTNNVATQTSLTDMTQYSCSIGIDSDVTISSYQSVIPFSTSHYDPSDMFNDTTKKIEIKKTGLYRISLSRATTNTSTDKRYIESDFYKNDVADIRFALTSSVKYISSNTYESASTSFILELNQGDTIHWDLECASYTGISLHRRGTFMTIDYIGGN